MSTISSVVVLVVIAVVIATAAGDRHQQELKEHYDHLAYIAEYNCHRPQPRVISVQELFSEEGRAHKAFFPDVTVLHRCDNYVGCCPSDHFCRAKHTVPLDLPFKITFLEDVDKHKRGSWIMEYHKFDNHTECECVDSSVCVPVTEDTKVNQVDVDFGQTTDEAWPQTTEELWSLTTEEPWPLTR